MRRYIENRLLPRTCTRCKETKPVTEFYPFKRDGRLFYLSKCRPCQAEYQAERRSIPEVRAKYNKVQLEFRRKHRNDPDFIRKNRAREVARDAVKNGSLIKPEACETKTFATECSGALQAHHYLGYAEANRLDVIWLCVNHHAEMHRLQRGLHPLINAAMQGL